MVKYHKVFPLETINKAKQERLFKVLNINASCNCILVWREIALDHYVLRVTFPCLQHTPFPLMLFSTLAQMT